MRIPSPSAAGAQAARLLAWFRTHRPVGIGVIVLLFFAFAGGVTLLSSSTGSGSSKKPVAKVAAPALSTNTVIAGYQKQLSTLATAAAKTPQDAKALDAYGVALYATGDPKGAQTQYEAELKINKSDAVLLNNLGNVYRDLGSYDSAVKSYQASIAIAPKTATAYVNLANLYSYTMNQNAEGIKTLQQALVSLPTNGDLGVLLGIGFERSGDKVQAGAAYQAVLKNDPTNTAALAGEKRLA